MRRILGLVLISSCRSPLLAAQNSQTFYLASATRAGNNQLSSRNLRGQLEFALKIASHAHHQGRGRKDIQGPRSRGRRKAGPNRRCHLRCRTGFNTCGSLTPAMPNSFFKTRRKGPNESHRTIFPEPNPETHAQPQVRISFVSACHHLLRRLAGRRSKCSTAMDERQPLARTACRSGVETAHSRREASASAWQRNGSQSAGRCP